MTTVKGDVINAIGDWTDLVGKPWKPVEKEITWRSTTNFAAALSDMNPRYIDDERAEGIVAHPMYVLPLTIPLVHWVYDQLPQEIFDTRVHYTEQIHYSRPIKPGQKVSVNAVIASIKPQKANTALTFKNTITDQDGNLLATEYHGIVLRGVKCLNEGKSIEDIPVIPKCPLTDAVSIWEVPIPIVREFPYLYDACTDIVFGIHTSPKFAHRVGLRDILVSGAPIIGYGLREIINRELRGDSSKVKTVYGRMTKMVFPESYVKVQFMHCEVENEIKRYFFQILSGEGEPVVKDGYVEIANKN